jgi:hypothetical protein
MLAESLLTAPAVLTVDLLCCENALLPHATPFLLLRTRNFGTMLEPRWIVGTGVLDQ